VPSSSTSLLLPTLFVQAACVRKDEDTQNEDTYRNRSVLARFICLGCLRPSCLSCITAASTRAAFTSATSNYYTTAATSATVLTDSY
jgi:hypothetical protein